MLMLFSWARTFKNSAINCDIRFKGNKVGASRSQILSKFKSKEYRIPYHFLHSMCKCMGRFLKVAIENMQWQGVLESTRK